MRDITGPRLHVSNSWTQMVLQQTQSRTRNTASELESRFLVCCLVIREGDAEHGQ